MTDVLLGLIVFLLSMGNLWLYRIYLAVQKRGT